MIFKIPEYQRDRVVIIRLLEELREYSEIEWPENFDEWTNQELMDWINVLCDKLEM